MTIDFKLPELGENIDSADVIKVNVAVGDRIEVDQVLLEIETDKATIEVPSEVAGTIIEVMIKEGEKANVGDVIFKIDKTAGEETNENKESSAEAVDKEKEKEKTLADEPSESVEEKTVDESIRENEEIVKTVEPVSTNAPKITAPATPTTRRFAREIGIDINQVKGSGPGGRISIDDVKLFAKELNERIGKGETVSGSGVLYNEELPDFSKLGNVRKEPMSAVRRKTAQHLSYAWSTIPHVTQFDKADVTKLEETRKRYAKQAEALGGKLTITAILLKVIAAGLRKFPDFNSSVDMKNGEIIYKDYCNVGVAVDTPRGLLVPVIKDADKKSILDLSVELTEISKKAREKKLTLDEMQGGNFTISNLGGIGGTAFTPVVNAPEVAILGVSRGVYEPVYIDGEFEPRLIMPLSLSYDHRVIDGALAAKFLRWVCESLENPILLLM
ncbi:MAG: branched-chain alpha-keto acid dehydrogenase subunit E2 [Chlorobi bacterium]|nr:branched-chain alpha-keto acid dehydrogenase subunit E2 [Chlorobiota bacterium]